MFNLSQEDEKLRVRLSALARAQGGEDSEARHLRNALVQGKLTDFDKRRAWELVKQ